MQESMSSGHDEIVRLTAALNQSKKSIALKNDEFVGLNATYNESIKMLNDKKKGNTLLILVIAELETSHSTI